MNAGLLNSFLVIWRESFEAVLVVFLIYSGLSRQGTWSHTRKYILSGIATGILLSFFFAYILLHFDSLMESYHAQIAQALFPLIASGLMLHMVIWMSRHSKQLSGEIREFLHSKSRFTITWGLFFLIAYNISREGFETVVYLYGLSLSGAHLFTPITLSLLSLAGVGSAVGLMWIIHRTTKFVRIKTFFLVTNIFLLGAAASMLVSGVNKLIELEILPPGLSPLWNSSHLLNAQSLPGSLAVQLVGYTPVPSLTLLLCYVAFWSLAVFFLKSEYKTR